MTDIEMQKKLEKEDFEVRNLITQFTKCPIQTLEERYEYVNKSRNEGNFEFFSKIADFIGKNFRYSIIDSKKSGAYFTATVSMNCAYDFEFILELARYYQKYTIVFLCGHLYLMQEKVKQFYSVPDAWEDIKSEWKKIIITDQ